MSTATANLALLKGVGGDIARDYLKTYLAASLDILDGAIPNVYNVKGATYGALGDGSTNDLAAIQAAINAAKTAGGGIVWFPKGTYIVHGYVDLDLAHNVTLQGVGAGTIIKQTNTTQILGAATASTDGLTIRDLTLDGNRTVVASTSVFGTYFQNCTNLLIHNVRVQNFHSDGIHIRLACDGVRIEGCHIENCRENGIYVGAESTSPTPPKNVTIVGNTIEGTPGDSGNGILFQWGANNCTVSGNTIKSISEYGILVADSTDISIVGNTIISSTLCGIDVYAATAAFASNNVEIVGNNISYSVQDGIRLEAAAASNGVSRVTISGNSIRNNAMNGIRIDASLKAITANVISDNILSTNGGATPHNGIRLILSDYNIISNNEIVDSAGHGIVLEGSSFNIIDGNLIKGSSTLTNAAYSDIILAISTATESTQNTIANNQLHSLGPSNFPLYGIRLNTASTTGNIVSGNRLRTSGGTTLFSSAATGNFVLDNPGYNPVGASVVNLAVAPATLTYTCGNSPAVLYIRGGVVTTVVKNTRTLLSGSTGIAIPLEPGEIVAVSYTTIPDEANADIK